MKTRVLSFVMVAMLILTSAAMAQNTTTITLDDNKDSTFKIDFLGVDYNIEDNTWTWRYYVSEVEGRSLSHWTLALDECVMGDLDVVSTTPEAGFEVGTDGSTGYVGVKWNVEDGFTEGEFSFTVKGDYAEGTVEALAKAGNGYNTGDLYGPVCQANPPVDPPVAPPVPPNTPAVPEPGTLLLLGVGLIGLLGFSRKKMNR